MEKTKCLIIGSGPAGFTAATYAARAAMQPIVYEGLTPGGQLTTTSEVENFPGYPDGVSGTVMMEDLRRQAERFGAEVRAGEVTAVDFSARPFIATIDGEKTIEAQSVIIATGATAKYLGLPSERKFAGMGVSACAVCDGFFYRDRNVAVVGGGDSACEEALYLAGICRKVYLIVRKDHLRASKTMQQRVFDNPRIEVLFGHVTEEILGDENGVTGVRLVGGMELAVDGFFLGIGHEPRTTIFRGHIELDDEGYILVGHKLYENSLASTAIPKATLDFVTGSSLGETATSVEGVFAAGDVADRTYQQAITAAAAGCKAALDCERFLNGLN